MKPINKCRALSLAILTAVVSNSESAEDALGISVIPIITSEVTSSEKHSLYGFNDKDLKAIQFTQINRVNLTADMAKGQGEFLNTLADLLEIPTSKRTAFCVTAKNKFTQLIPDFHTTAAQLVFNLKTEAAKL